MTGECAIEARRLRKTFGTKTAVADLTLQVHRGEVFGFLGPNGAGKTTSLKMFLGLAAPTSGSASLLGRPAGDPEVRRRIGFLPEHFRFHEWLTAEEFLRLHGTLYGMPAPRLNERVGGLLEMVGLTPHRDDRLRDFSKGMLQRAGLAQALLNEPELIFLDEPTSGLDPVGRILVRDIIREQRQRGATVFLNSHLLSEVEVTCDRVGFVKHGKVLETRALNGFSTGRAVSARVRTLCPEAIAALELCASDVRFEGGRVTMSVKNQEVLPEIARILAAVGLYSLESEQVSLEDLFFQILGNDGGL